MEFVTPPPMEPVVYPTARQGDAFLRAHPRARAADIHAAFRDPWHHRHNRRWEQIRVLSALDPAVLREHPTRFFGMSDNTNLSVAL